VTDVDVFGLSDIGLVREVNEDYFIVNRECNFFLVADGMGGHRGGDVASRQAAQVINEFVASVVGGDDITWPFDYNDNWSYHANMLNVAIKHANKQLIRIIRRHPELEGMGTTFVGLLLDNHTAYMANVGDSRVYLLRKEQLRQISRDHSFINEQIQQGRLNREEARLSPFKNIITRALGTYEDLEVDLFNQPTEPGDIFFLCSDGLSNLIPDGEITDIILNNEDDLQRTAEGLVTLAKRRGGEDNITFILVRVL